MNLPVLRCTASRPLQAYYPVYMPALHELGLLGVVDAYGTCALQGKLCQGRMCLCIAPVGAQSCSACHTSSTNVPSSATIEDYVL